MKVKILKKMREKGQAASTFQLLISAVVAMALLGILVPIVMKVMGTVQSDAISSLKQKMGSAKNNLGSEVHVGKITLSKRSSVSAKTLADAVALDKSQVCFCIASEALQDSFSVSGDGDISLDLDSEGVSCTASACGGSLKYTGSSRSKEVDSSIICDEGEDGTQCVVILRNG